MTTLTEAPSRPTRRCRSSASPATSPPRPQQLFRAHTDPELFARWVGPGRDGHPHRRSGTPRTGGSWRYVADRDGERVRLPRVLPRGAAGPHRADLHLRRRSGRRRAGDPVVRGPGRRAHPAARASLCESFEARDAWLRERHGGRRQRGLRQARRRCCARAPSDPRRGAIAPDRIRPGGGDRPEHLAARLRDRPPRDAWLLYRFALSHRHRAGPPHTAQHVRRASAPCGSQNLRSGTPSSGPPPTCSRAAAAPRGPPATR